MSTKKGEPVECPGPQGARAKGPRAVLAVEGPAHGLSGDAPPGWNSGT